MNTDVAKVPAFTPTQVVAVFVAIVTELLNDAVIDGHWAKILTGLAGIVVPAVWIFANAIIHHAHVKAMATVEAARVMAAAAVPSSLHIK